MLDLYDQVPSHPRLEHILCIPVPQHNAVGVIHAWHTHDDALLSTWEDGDGQGLHVEEDNNSNMSI